MNRSGMKRGLAASAVAALAVSGITLGLPGSASAAGGVDWKTQLSTNIGSVQDDGTNSTIHLQATGNGAKMLFEYSTNGGTTYTEIASVGPVSGVAGLFSAEWAPPASVHNTDVLVRATALTSVDTPIVGASDEHLVHVSTVDHAVNIANAPGSALGVYQRPGDPANPVGGIITGTTSDIVGGATVVVDSVNGASNDTNADYFGDVSGNTRPFSAVVDFTGDPVGTGYALARAVDGSDDVEPVKLYAQTVGSINVEADRTLVPTGETATATVTVLDQNGKPIAGLRVRRDGGAPIPSQLTDSRGKATFEDLPGSGGGTLYRFYADFNNNADYSEATEFAKTVTITSYTPVVTKISAATPLGHAWDEDEIAAVRVRIDDQNNNGFGPRQFQYQWTLNPTGGGAPTTFGVQTGNTLAGGPNKGTQNIGDVPTGDSGTWTLNAWIETDGTPGLTAGDTIRFTDSFKVGQATVKWTDGTVAQRQAGTTQQFEGVLSLPDGTPLTGRQFGVTLGAQNGAENAVMAAQAAQPAGATRAPIPNGDTLVNVVTDGNGKFKVAVSDPSGNFEDRTLSAAGGNFGPATLVEIDFMDVTVATVTLAGDTPVSIDGHTLTPGRPTKVGDVQVKNAAGQLLTDKEVTISVDRGYLSAYDGVNLVGTDQSNGALAGTWKHVPGDTTATFTTPDGPVLGGGDRGTVRNKVAAVIERDAGFDDDGQVTTKITAASAGKSATDNVVWSSANPLNAKQVTLTFATDNVSKILPKAATYLSNGQNGTDQGVNLDVVTTDQFGNRTGSATTLSDNSATATVSGSGTGQFTGDAPHVNAQSNDATGGDQTVTSTWAGRKNTWQAGAIVGANNPVAGTATISWYVIDPATSTFSMTHTGGSEAQPVGGTVTESYTAIDQNGQPMAWREVDFFRTGPDQLQNGNPQQTTHSSRTNANGVATYVFQGARAGTAILAGLLYDQTDQPIEASKTSDTVTFADPVTPPSVPPAAAITAKLTLSNTKRGADVLLVKTSPAAVGAKVSFYKVVNGKKVLLGTGKVRANGYAKATIADKKKKKFTTYSVTIAATAKTKAATSNTARIK